MAHDVRIHGTQAQAKVRSPAWVVVWSFFTVGIYTMYWWYQVNRELRDVGRARGTSELGDSPGTSLLAVSLGSLIIVPLFVSIYNGTKRIQAAQALAGLPENQWINGWMVVAFMVLVFIVGIPFAPGYIQSELNKLWKNPSIAEQPPEVMSQGLPTAAPAPPPPAGQQPVAPPPPVGAPPAPPPPPPPAAQTPATPPPPPPAGPQTQPAGASPAPPPPPVGAGSHDGGAELAKIDQLERLAALRDSGALSAEEYEEQKKKILSEL